MKKQWNNLCRDISSHGPGATYDVHPFFSVGIAAISRTTDVLIGFGRDCVADSWCGWIIVGVLSSTFLTGLHFSLCFFMLLWKEKWWRSFYCNGYLFSIFGTLDVILCRMCKRTNQLFSSLCFYLRYLIIQFARFLCFTNAESHSLWPLESYSAIIFSCF